MAAFPVFIVLSGIWLFYSIYTEVKAQRKRTELLSRFQKLLDCAEELDARSNKSDVKEEKSLSSTKNKRR